MAITLSGIDLGDLAARTGREWLLTNGLGGYAAGTVSGVATRRYHGLLVAALSPPRGRHVLVSHLDETVVDGYRHTALSSHAFPGAVTPDGWRHITRFALAPLPTWDFAVDDLRIERSIAMLHGTHTVVVRYRHVAGPRAVSLRLRPFGVWRDFHHHTRGSAAAKLAAETDPARPGEAVLRPYPTMPAVRMRAPGVFHPSPDWWRDFEHAAESARGLDDREDAFTPGEFVVALGPAETVYVALTTEATLPDDLGAAFDAEADRLGSLAPADEPDPRVRALLRAVDAYRCDRANPPALLAGYPWFEDWGRDTLIAFTGVYLVPGRYDDARRLLAAFARYVDQGMVPNRFPDGGGGHADYNTVDAPLWLFHAARRYAQYTGDLDFLRDTMAPALEDIVAHYTRGTRYDIRVGADGLVYAGNPGTQLTWMDAKVGDQVFTPRHGAPVEINALWHAGRRTLAWLYDRVGDTARARAHRAAADAHAAAFRAAFWNAPVAYLFDVVRPWAGATPRCAPTPSTPRPCPATCSPPRPAPRCWGGRGASWWSRWRCGRCRRTTRRTAGATGATRTAATARTTRARPGPSSSGPTRAPSCAPRGGCTPATPRPSQTPAPRCTSASPPSIAPCTTTAWGTSRRSSKATRRTTPSAASPRPGATPRCSASCTKTSTAAAPPTRSDYSGSAHPKGSAAGSEPQRTRGS
jgi:predicted glycogen debranching enzyme